MVPRTNQMSVSTVIWTRQALRAVMAIAPWFSAAAEAVGGGWTRSRPGAIPLLAPRMDREAGTAMEPAAG